MELDIKKWTDLFKDTKLVRPENESRNRKLLKEFITQNRIVCDNIVLKTSAKIKVYSIGSNEVNFSGEKKLHSYLKQYLSVNARCTDVIESNVKNKKGGGK